MEWAKKTGRVQGAEQQELLEFARKTLEAAEKDGDIFKPAAGKKRGADEEAEELPPPPPKTESKSPSAPLVGALTHVPLPCLFTTLHPDSCFVYLNRFVLRCIGTNRWRHEFRPRSVVSLGKLQISSFVSRA